MIEPGLDVGYDPSVWVNLDPGDADPQDWAVERAELCWAEAALPADPPAVALLSTRLLAMYEQSTTLPATWVLTYLRDPLPNVSPGPLAAIAVIDATDGSEESLREVAGATDELAIEPPQVSWLETPLGTALRCRRFAQERATGRRPFRRGAPVMLAYTYVWHLPAVDSTVRLSIASGDIGELTAIETDLDDLARTLRMIDMAD